jgi:hypothetical protein
VSTPNPFAPQVSQLVTQEKLEQFNQQLRVLDNAQRESELLQRAGIDQTDNLAKIQSARDIILRFKAVYFPGQ